MSLEGLTDEELMVMYQNGSESAFEVLYHRHSTKVFGFLKSRIQISEKVPDIYQEVFIKMHKSKHLYNKTLPVLPWIFTITKSVMLDSLKTDKSSKIIDGFDLDQIPAPVGAGSAQLNEADILIRKLSGNQKRAMQMRFINDKTFEEIADSLKTSPGNVRQLITRGVKRLKELLGDRETQ